MRYALIVANGLSFGMNVSNVVGGSAPWFLLLISVIGYGGAMYVFWLTRPPEPVRLYL